MLVPIVYEDGTENEIELELCCAKCAHGKYDLSPATFINIKSNIDAGIPIKVSNSVDGSNSFLAFIKNAL